MAAPTIAGPWFRRLSDKARPEFTDRGADRGRTKGGRLSDVIYKICKAAEWRDAERSGVFRGTAVDLADGFIHFSDVGQVDETAAKHFAGVHDLVLIAVAAPALGSALKREPSRGGALFPHLHGPLRLDAVLWIKPLPLGSGGRHVFPELAP